MKYNLIVKLQPLLCRCDSFLHQPQYRKTPSWLFGRCLSAWNTMMTTKKNVPFVEPGHVCTTLLSVQCRTDSRALAPPHCAQLHLCVRDPHDVIGPGVAVLGRGAGKALLDASVRQTLKDTLTHTSLSQSGSTSAVHVSRLTADWFFCGYFLLLAASLWFFFYELYKHLASTNLSYTLWYLCFSLCVCLCHEKQIHQH